MLVIWKRKSNTVVSEKGKLIDDELKRLKATWRFVEIEVRAKKVPEKAFEKDTLVLKGNQFTSYVAGKSRPRSLQDRPARKTQDH